MIRNLSLTILILGLLSLISLFTPALVRADSQSEIIQRVDSDIQIANNLLSEIESIQDNPDAILETLLREIPKVTKYWRESSNFYLSKILTEKDEQLKLILGNINRDINDLSSSLLSVEEAINTEDEETYLSGLEEYDSYIESLNSHVEDLNNHFGVADYSWLAWPFWISLIISVGLFIMSRGSPVLPAEQLRNQFEFALFKSSLWPLIGSAITYFWYLSTPPGGEFTIFYGLIGVGFFQFFRGLYTYISQARPAIELAKREEKSKLESLIRSEHFQKESMEEMAKEIGRRGGVINLSKDKKKEK